MTRIDRVLICALVLSLPLASACRRKQENLPPVATAAVGFNHPKAPLGSPLDVTYKFTVAANAPAFGQDYWVMVHFLDADQELMWTDDHVPAIPTSQWKPGQVIEYKRTLFVPVYPYIGVATVQMGLYSPKDGKRLTLTGDDNGQRAYKVGTLTLLPSAENVFVMFKDGWNSQEVAPDNATVQWQWTKKIAVLAFRNPKRESTLYLQADNPGTTFTEQQSVQVQVDGQTVDTVTITPKHEIIHRTQIPAAALGTGDMAEVRLVVDKTFVPALMPGSNNRDNRELGIRVFHAFIEPRP